MTMLKSPNHTTNSTLHEAPVKYEAFVENAVSERTGRPLRVCMLAYAFYESDTRILQYATALAQRIMRDCWTVLGANHLVRARTLLRKTGWGAQSAPSGHRLEFGGPVSGFERALDRHEEPGGVGAVEGTVIPTHCQVAHRMDGDAKAHRDTDDHSDDGRNDGAVDRREGTEDLRLLAPALGPPRERHGLRSSGQRGGSGCDVSVGALFVSGVIPGVILGLATILLVL